MKGLFVIQWLDFPTGNRPFGGGGWSRNARHRPMAVPFQQVVEEIEEKGKSFIIDGKRKLKLNIYDVNKKTWLRTDYPDLRKQFEFHQTINQHAIVPCAPMRVGPRVIRLQ